MPCFLAKKRLNKQSHPFTLVLSSLEVNVKEGISELSEKTRIDNRTPETSTGYKNTKSAVETAPRPARCPLFEISPDSPPGPPSLITMPPAIHHLLFDILSEDVATSLCLALTCKRFYAICEAHHSNMKVDLNFYIPCIHAGTELRKECGHKEFLYQYLADWFPEDYYFEWRVRKFIPIHRRSRAVKELNRAWDYAEDAWKGEFQVLVAKREMDRLENKDWEYADRVLKAEVDELMAEKERERLEKEGWRILDFS